MHDRLWFGLKALLSALLLLGASILALFVWRVPGQFAFLGLAAVFLLFAALPWVDFTRPNRALGLVLILFALGMGLLAWQDAHEVAAWPKSCSGRGSAICGLKNLLWMAGGPVLAALPWALLAAVLLVAGARVLRRAGRGA